jgi:hypothetical protein
MRPRVAPAADGWEEVKMPAQVDVVVVVIDVPLCKHDLHHVVHEASVRLALLLSG